MTDDLSRERFRRDSGRPPIAVPRPGAGAALLVQVFAQTSIPTALGVFYACHPCRVFGTEAEGTTGTGTDHMGGLIVVDATRTVYVLFGGSKAPVAGEYYAARYVGNRWYAERMTHVTGVTGTSFTCGFCSPMPDTLHLLSTVLTDPDHTPPDDIVFGPCPIPGGAFANATAQDPGYWGRTTFTDSTGSTYVYNVTCNAFSGYSLLKAYLYNVVEGSSFYNSGALWSWSAGHTGNSCVGGVPGHNSPPSGYTFYMINGSAGSGYDPSANLGLVG